MTEMADWTLDSEGEGDGADTPICICLGATCGARGNRDVLAEFESELGISEGETTLSGKFSLEVVYCMGACRMGPNVMIGNNYYSDMSPSQVREVLAEYEDEEGETLYLEGSCPFCQNSLEGSEGEGLEFKALLQGERGKVKVEFTSSKVIFETSLDWEEGKAAALSCSHCQMPLEEGGRLCSKCHGEVISLEGGLWFCVRRGCGNFGSD